MVVHGHWARLRKNCTGECRTYVIMLGVGGVALLAGVVFAVRALARRLDGDTGEG